MRVAIALAVVVASVVVSPAPPAAPPETATYEDALAAFRAGDYEGAAEVVRALLDETPAWAGGHVFLGQCLYLLGKPEDAAKSIVVGAELDPDIDLFAALFSVGANLYRHKRFDDAIAPLESALTHVPATDERWAPASVLLAQACLVTGRYEDARRHLESRQARRGADAESSYYLALACQKLGDYACALASLRQEASDNDPDPNRAKALEYLARWSRYWALLPENEDRRQGLVEQAIEDARPWYAAAPGDRQARRAYGEALLAAHREQDLVSEILPLAESDPDDCTVRLMLARAFDSLGNGREAENWARAAAACDPSLSDAQVEIAAASILQLPDDYSDLDEVRTARERARGAAAALEHALSLDPRHTRAASLLTEVRATLGRLDEVEEAFVTGDTAREVAEIRERCLNIIWRRRHGTEALTPDEDAFYREHDCARYSPP